MNEQSLAKFKSEPWRSLAFLISLFFVRLGIQIVQYRRNFISVAADEFSRGIRAALWAENPRVDLIADLQATWLPFEKYLNGIALLVWPDVIVGPRLTVFIASCVVLLFLYLLVYYLFDSFAIAVASTIYVSLLPWYVWLSGTPMLEMYYFACFFAGLLFLIVWLREARSRYWLWAGLCFLLATGFHVQSWTFINLVNLLTLPSLYQFYRQKEYTKVRQLIAYYFIGNGLILIFAVGEFALTGEVFAFLQKHTSYSKWFYNGYNVSIDRKLLFYPRLILRHSSVVTWINLVVAFVFLARAKERRWLFFPLLLMVLALTLNSVMNVFSGPPSAAPARYSLFYVMVLSIYGVGGLYYLFQWGQRQAVQVVRWVAMLTAVFLFAYGLWWGMARIPNYPPGNMPIDTVDTGRALNLLLDENPGTYMVELLYWDYLGVSLTAQHYDDRVFDREKDFLNRDIPSIFTQEVSEICDVLTAVSNLQYVALKDDASNAQAQTITSLDIQQHIGSWTIYAVNSDACAER